MISVDDATRIVLQEVPAPVTESIPLEQALGRTLARALYADRDFPPFTRVSMDGIAIRHAAFSRGIRRFRIEGTQMAGQSPLRLESDDACLEIMTGAALPDGADTIIRYEDVQIENGVAELQVDVVFAGQNAHLQGLDRLAGDMIVSENRKLSAAEIGVAATVGAHTLTVYRQPKLLIVPTGDELVPVHEQPLPHQIRHSNGPTLRALCEGWGASVELHTLQDQQQVIREFLESALDGSRDALIFTGAVSKGKTDFLPAELERAGVQKHFHLVQQRPGKPFWFGRHPNGTVVFALPGNPVSAFMGCVRYVQPWLQKLQALPPFATVQQAVLQAEVVFKPRLTCFLPVRIEYSQQGLVAAHPVPGKGSGDLANLADADGFLELPADTELFHPNEIYPYWGWRS